jgi:hypothetical protein
VHVVTITFGQPPGRVRPERPIFGQRSTEEAQQAHVDVVHSLWKSGSIRFTCWYNERMQPE